MNNLIAAILIIISLIGLAEYLITGCIYVKGIGRKCGNELVASSVVLVVLVILGVYILVSEYLKKKNLPVSKNEKDS